MHARAETSCALNSASSLVAGAWGPDDGGRRPLLFMEPIARCWASGLSRQHHHPHPSVSYPAFLYHPSFSLSHFSPSLTSNSVRACTPARLSHAPPTPNTSALFSLPAPVPPSSTSQVLPFRFMLVSPLQRRRHLQSVWPHDSVSGLEAILVIHHRQQRNI